MSGQLEAAWVRQLERRHQHLADRAEAFAATYASNLRGAAASLRSAADRACRGRELTPAIRAA
jgi:hypothetical protein